MTPDSIPSVSIWGPDPALLPAQHAQHAQMMSLVVHIPFFQNILQPHSVLEAHISPFVTDHGWNKDWFELTCDWSIVTLNETTRKISSLIIDEIGLVAAFCSLNKRLHNKEYFLERMKNEGYALLAAGNA